MNPENPSSTSDSKVIPQVLNVENVKALQLIRTIAFPKQDITYLYWSTDNKRLLVFSCDPDMEIWPGDSGLIVRLSALTVIDPISGQEIRQVPVDNFLIPKFFSGDGRFISVIESATSDPHNNWKGHFLDVDTGEKVGPFYTRVYGVDNTGQTMVLDRGDGLSIASLQSGVPILTLRKWGNATYVDRGTFSRDGSFYAQPGYSSDSCFIDFWNSGGIFLCRTLPFSSFPLTLSFIENGPYLVTYFNDLGKARVELYDSFTGTSRQVIEWTWPSTFKNPFVSISPDGMLAAFSNVIMSQNEPNSVIEILNTLTKEIAAIIPVPKTDREIPTAFSGDGRWLAYATRSIDNTESWQINVLEAKP